MNKEELIKYLLKIAVEDARQCTVDEIEDHPCTIAIRALNQCFEDINTLRFSGRLTQDQWKCLSPEDQNLHDEPYNPEW